MTMKRLILVCVMILCLVPMGGWAEEEIYEISQKSWVETTELIDSVYVEEFHCIGYNERGLPVSYKTVYKSRSSSHLYTYHRGVIVDSVELDQDESKLNQSLIGFTDPFLEYDFVFDFDDFGNPLALRMTPNADIEALEFTFDNQYEDGVLVYVSITSLIDPTDDLPIYDLFGHFYGYRNAILDFGRQSYQNKDGKLIRSERSVGYGIVLVYIQEFQYDGEHLTKGTQISYAKELPEMDETVTVYDYDSDGRLIAITGNIGESVETMNIAYTDATDELGRAYDRGVMSVSDTDLPESFDPTEAFVSCYWHDNGKLAEIVISPTEQERIVVRYDRQGNEIYNELYIDGNQRTFKTTNYLYQDWTRIELH